jgi:hypothetical protein
MTIVDAVERLKRYPAATLRRYDLPGAGSPDVLTAEEVTRTRVVNSRISDLELRWFLAHAADAPWPAGDADLRAADPAESGGLYDAMTRLYDHLSLSAPPGIAVAKISKVLHVKRPALFPILDSHINAAYRRQARATARRYPARGHRSMTWAAIRDDLVRNTESGALTAIREAARTGQCPTEIAAVTDLRLLDMLTW